MTTKRRRKRTRKKKQGRPPTTKLWSRLTGFARATVGKGGRKIKWHRRRRGYCAAAAAAAHGIKKKGNIYISFLFFLSFYDYY